MEWLLRRIVDHRITHTNTVDRVGKSSKSIVTIIYYGTWKKAVYFMGKRIK